MPLSRSAAPLTAAFAACTAAAASPIWSQELPASGVFGVELFYASSPAGDSQLFGVSLLQGLVPVPIGASVQTVPSRWAHRRRVMGAMETQIALADSLVLMTPMGDAPGNGAVHLVDLRQGLPAQTALAPTGNPPSYDLAVVESLDFAFAATDDGKGNTVLHGFSYSGPGALAPLSPPTLTLQGSPAAYVNRIGIDESALELHIPTADGVHVVHLASGAPQMAAGAFVSSLPHSPTTNPTSFDRSGTTTWIVGTSAFDAFLDPLEAGYLSWDASGVSDNGAFGVVPSAATKRWIPAAGTEELAVVSDGTDAYVYYLLREPPPGTFFIKPSAIGAVRFLGAAAPIVSTIPMTDAVGEPFANPSVMGTRVAFESSLGPPFIQEPPGGGEKLSLIYSPLDPLGAGSLDGVLAVPDPLGGRISTKGMDRPVWSRDGTRLMGATSHFPGAPNPGVPGLEVLNVPADVSVDEFTGPATIVANDTFPNQSIVHPGTFLPRDPVMTASLAGYSFYGNVFHDGLAAIVVTPFGELGQKQLDPVGFTQDPDVPGFPAVFPPIFDDTSGNPTEPIPAHFGARRTAFNAYPGLGLMGVTMTAALDDRLLVQLTGWNALSALGVVPALPPAQVSLPAGWVTTSEILSL